MMRTYDSPLVDAVRRWHALEHRNKVGEGLSGMIWDTPGDQRDAEDSLNVAITNLGSDIYGSTAPVEFVQAWNTFQLDWDDFYKSQGTVGGWFSRFLTAGAMGKVADYRAQLEAWRTRFVGLGGTSSAPSLPPPMNPLAPLEGLLKTLTTVIIVGGVVYVGVKGLSLIKKPAR